MKLIIHMDEGEKKSNHHQIGKYYPYHGGNNPLFDEFSRTTLDFKKGMTSAIRYFAKLVNGRIQKHFANLILTIVIVPSHDPRNKITPLHDLVGLLKNPYNKFFNGSSCLKRISLINKLSEGGDRSMEVHLNSIKVIDKHLIAEKNILIIDDVRTSGNSLDACTKLLKAAGAQRVFTMVLAQTT